MKRTTKTDHICPLGQTDKVSYNDDSPIIKPCKKQIVQRGLRNKQLYIFSFDFVANTEILEMFLDKVLLGILFKFVFYEKKHPSIKLNT